MKQKELLKRYKIYKYGLIASLILAVFSSIVIFMLINLVDEARVNYQNKRIFMDQENFDIAIKNEYNKGVNIMYKACVENLKQQVEEQKQQPSINILDILIKSLGIFG